MNTASRNPHHAGLAHIGCVLLAAVIMMSACGDGGGSGDVIDTPNACNDLCPDEECQFGMCIETSDCGGACPPEQCVLGVCQNPDAGFMDVEDGCISDDDCDNDTFCDLPEGSERGDCVAGCREGGCDEGFACDLDTRECVEDVEDECAEDTDCDEGLTCVEGRCAGDACDAETPCPEGFSCDEDLGRCVAGCEANEDCPDNQYCDTEDTKVCLVGCRDDDACDPGESCLLLGVVEGLRQRCVPTPCAADTDCADGFYCDEDEGRCEVGCRIDPDDCNPGSTCDPDTRACQGDACEDNGDCNPGQFCDLLEDPPACVPGCNNDDGCRGDLGCDLLLNACRCEDAGDDCFLDQVCFLGRCSDECTLDTDCAEGFVCNTDDGVCESTCEDDDNEPNNAPEEAVSIDEGSYDHRMCYQAIEGFEWADCFSIQMRFDEVLRVELSFDDNVGDLDLRLFDPDLLFVDVSDTGTGNEGLAYLARDNGRHVFCVEPKGDARYEMDYGLEVAVDDAPLPCLEDFNEAIGDNSCNEARQNPIALAIDEPVFLDGRSICEGDEDFFAMRVRPGQVLSAILERGDGVAPLDIEVLDADCSTVLAQSDTFGPVRNLEYSVDVEGDVYVRVFTEDPLLTADYSLTITAEAGDFLCPEDVINNVPLEPNDTPDQATILNLERGETETIEDLFTCFDDVDLYSVLVLNRFDTITANLTQSADAPPLALAVLGEDGEQVLVQNLDPTEIKTVESPGLQPGNYYVRVTSFAEDFPPAGVNYDLDVLLNTDQFCLDDGFEPNNSIEAATPIIEGQTDAVSCRLENSESDVYKVALGTGDRVRISISYDHTRIAPLDALPTILYGPGGLADFRDFSIRDGDTDIDLFTVPEFVVPSTDVGDWFIEVGAGDTGLSVDYSLIVEIEQPDCDDTLPELFEPNEDCAGAFELAIGERLNGFICGPTGDEDFFEVDTEPGQSLLLRAEYFHFDGNLDMEVFELDTFVDGSYQVGPNFEQVRVDNTSGGTYCVRIFTDGELTQNNYSIEATIE